MCFVSFSFAVWCNVFSYVHVLHRMFAQLEYLEVDQYIWDILSDPVTAKSTEIILKVSPERIMASVATDRREQRQRDLFLLVS